MYRTHARDAILLRAGTGGTISASSQGTRGAGQLGMDLAVKYLSFNPANPEQQVPCIGSASAAEAGSQGFTVCAYMMYLLSFQVHSYFTIERRIKHWKQVIERESLHS